MNRSVPPLSLLILILILPACAELPLPTAPDTEGRGTAALASAPVGRLAPLPSTVEDFLGLGVGPMAIAHRGMGANLGEDPTRPLENSLAAIRGGFETGASVVELDLQITGDGEIVAWHDDFLEDFTCLNTLTRRELELRVPHIPSLQAVLQTALRYNRRNPNRLSWLLTVDLKPPSPLCDPGDRNEAAIVEAVVRIIRQMGATDLVYFNSMFPVMLSLARDLAPEIPRQLTLLFLQLLSPEEVEAALGLPVVEVEKHTDFGLRWAEIGPIHRLPGYDSPMQAIQTAHAVGARIISLDLLLLGYLEQTSPESGAALGAEALYADDVPLTVSLQPALP